MLELNDHTREIECKKPKSLCDQCQECCCVCFLRLVSRCIASGGVLHSTSRRNAFASDVVCTAVGSPLFAAAEIRAYGSADAKLGLDGAFQVSRRRVSCLTEHAYIAVQHALNTADQRTLRPRAY
eukprot:1038567-Rhodomonas_salina.1